MAFVVPDACTLPTAAQPPRVAELDALFGTAVQVVDRVDSRHLRLGLAGPAGLVATVRDLTTRESQCCSFFAFTITPADAAGGEAVTVDVEVPAQYTEILDQLADRARTAGAGRPA